MLKFAEIEKIILEAMDDEDNLLNSWETDFVKSTADRMAKYDKKTVFTEKQISTIQAIKSKLDGELTR